LLSFISKSFFLIVALAPLLSLAFPETARHGYTSCAVCHYSPSGRGLLTPYGKTISKELYSAFRPQESEEAVDEDHKPTWRVGGQFRLLQYFSKTPSIEKARFFPMQAELESAFDHDSWSIVAGLGAWRPIDATQTNFRAYSRNHYLLYRFSDQVFFRLGHFRMSHGLGLPDHKILAYESLGWTHSHETYNAEFSYIADDLVVQTTLVAPSKLLVTEELIKGASLDLEKSFDSRHKLGFNLSQFERDQIFENQFNLHGVGAINDESFLQAELAYRQRHDNGSPKTLAAFTRYSYELAHRLRPFIQIESANTRATSSTHTERASIGMEWFPINNFDLFISAGHETSSAADESSLLTAIGHFYF
jgi:hypothetical protein